MKNKHATYFFFLLLFITSSTLYAQHSFESKKKLGNPANISSIHAKQIKYSGRNAQGRRGTPNQLSQNRNFNPSLNNAHRILQRNKNSLPTFIETKRDVTSSQSSTRKDFRMGCADYLKEFQPLLKMAHPEENFIVQRFNTDDKNFTHLHLQQFYKGVLVYGAEVAIHLNASGEGETFNGKYLNLQTDINIIPSVSDDGAIERVKIDVAKRLAIRPLTTVEATLVEHAEPKSTLCIYENNGLVHTPTLAYHIVYCPSVHARLEYFIDAQTGNVLHHFNSTCFVDGPRTASATDLNGVSRIINTYQKGSTFYMIDASRIMYNAASSTIPDNPLGGILTIDLNNTFGKTQSFSHLTSSNNTWTNATAVSAHNNAGTAYEYYRTKHNRNSIDGDGGTIISIINTPDENGAALDNAYWNGKAMFYGNGNVAFKKLAGAIDVAGHEMTHGVVQNTANLEYQGESGAINESIADIFGTMMDPSDWNIGEDVIKIAAFPSGALRSMADPHNGGTSLSDAGYQPSHVNEKYTGSEDNGGVHINSGITNHAFYLLAEAITRDKAADVFYKALKDYLTKSSQFIDLRLAVVKAAGDLYGTSSTEVTQAGVAFDAVGIGDGQGGNYSESLPTNPGTEFLLLYNTDPTDPNSIYRASTTSATSLSSTISNSRPSVTDDGSKAVFVAGDHTIHVIVTDPNLTQNEFVLQNQPIWSNAVISKGGNRLAAVTTSQDQSIYVYDFTTEKWATFGLYNPTFSEGVTSEGPLYADALEWDYSGESLVYDAFNSLVNSSGANIEYWDVNFIHVWDIAASDFSDGEVSKLFSSLPDGVSIGDPSFAKTNPNIIAFDYIDEGTGEYDILGMNIETNDVNVISVNNSLGWPSYNKNDTRVGFTSDNSVSNFKTVYVTLNNDKISSNGIATDLFDLSQWPVYFSVGDRGVGDDEVVTSVHDEKKQVSLSCYPNPFVDEVSLQFNQDIIGNGQFEIANIMGQRVVDFKVERSTSDVLTLKLPNLPQGQYILHFQNGNAKGTCKLAKIK